MRTRTFIGLLSCLCLVLCLCVTPSANAAAEEEVLQVMTNFHKAFSTGDLELMYSLHWHSPNTTKFTPSKSGAFLTQGWEAIEEGWKETLKPEFPKGTYSNSTHNTQVTMLADNVAVITGYFIMTINPPAEKEQTISQFRQTLVVQKIGGKWLIVHEHTSEFPIK
jgi:uncharacterized protein (TIGR02246 family)